MKGISAEQWTGSPDNAIIAQIEISEHEIVALGGSLERWSDNLGEVTIAAFELRTGELVSLSRPDGTPAPGYTLIVAGGNTSGILDEFLSEAGLGRDRVTRLLRP
jgi:hypothetical protein